MDSVNDFGYAREIFNKLCAENGITGWTIELKKPMKSYLAKTRHRDKRVFITTEAIQEDALDEIIAHEVAHILTPGAHHGPAWQREARRLGVPNPKSMIRAEKHDTYKKVQLGNIIQTPGAGICEIIKINRVNAKYKNLETKQTYMANKDWLEECAILES
jgi:hypothetical protein